MIDKNGVAFSSPVLQCIITVEKLTSQGAVKNYETHKNAKMSIVRNEFRDILLQLDTGKSVDRYYLKNYDLYKRFVKDGKVTFHLKDQLLKLMVSNAPPNSLLCMLKLLSEKHLKDKENKENIPSRKRLLSNIPKLIEDISPIMIKDLESMRERNGQMPLQVRNPNVGLEGSSPVSSKRKFPADEKGSESRSKIAKCLNPLVLNKDQKRVMAAIHSGHNVFFTGSAGTGKSFLLRRIVSGLPPESTFVTASTGIAACHIGGTTLHSFAGIGAGSAPLEECYNMAKRKAFYQQWRKCKHLIIDEISMVDGMFFQKMEAVARYVKGNDKPFGGIQLVLSGDFFQLPPVAKRGEKRRFCFQTSAWNKCVNANVELTEVKRQDDHVFINVLQNLRVGRCTKEDEAILKETANNSVEKDGIKATRLCTHKDAVDHINSIHLEKLPGERKLYCCQDSDMYMTDTLDASMPVVSKLELKVGAQVMLMKNLDISKGLVNGARGVVTSLNGSQGLPVVKFACGQTREMGHEKWTVKTRGGMAVTRRQIPLKLAWAFSIHKSQGMTLDCVEMSLSKVFEAGQSYVALSRARNLRSLRILDFEPDCIKADPVVKIFYSRLKQS